MRLISSQASSRIARSSLSLTSIKSGLSIGESRPGSSATFRKIESIHNVTSFSTMTLQCNRDTLEAVQIGLECVDLAGKNFSGSIGHRYDDHNYCIGTIAHHCVVTQSVCPLPLLLTPGEQQHNHSRSTMQSAQYHFSVTTLVTSIYNESNPLKWLLRHAICV